MVNPLTKGMITNHRCLQMVKQINVAKCNTDIDEYLSIHTNPTKLKMCKTFDSSKEHVLILQLKLARRLALENALEVSQSSMTHLISKPNFIG